MGIINRRGLGRTRHIDTGLLWIQQTAAEKRLQHSKVLGTINPADLMIKYLSAEINEGHCARLGVQFTRHRAEAAPTPSRMMEGKAVWELDVAGVTARRRERAKKKTILKKKWKHSSKEQSSICSQRSGTIQ